MARFREYDKEKRAGRAGIRCPPGKTLEISSYEKMGEPWNSSFGRISP